MAEFSSGNSETGSKENDFKLKLKAVGLVSDPYNLPKHQWFTDIYCNLVSMQGKYKSLKQKSGRQPPTKMLINTILTDSVESF